MKKAAILVAFSTLFVGAVAHGDGPAMDRDEACPGSGKPDKPGQWTFTRGAKVPCATWDAQRNAFIWSLKHDMTFQVEVIGGGGGGGGSYGPSGKGGSRGGAGGYDFKLLTLVKGEYVIEVGAGGEGGRAYTKNESPRPAKPGGISAVRTRAGMVLIGVRGGEAGRDSNSGSPMGEDGESVRNALGELISQGGKGGEIDRGAGTAAGAGAGGGGAGLFRGPTNYFAGSGGDGRVVFHTYP